ncbi:hypothetical protein PC117_g5747 [Phytophthora cactorum]|uniref:WW domain-containing protein n=1 Tax=Phytophthora cactorum TaxID=29920 RepID=A0A8T1E5M1_9STRA|nr:hypothetical protein PC117_g5747 [Phytophthora cactorum]
MTPQEHLLFLMTESTTRDFISQWPYDHGQSYDDVRGESTMQWRGVDRVAEQMRQREERHLEDAFATINFETRAAALEAYFFQPPRHASFVSDRESPTARPVARVRPQSASLMRRAAENNGANNNKTRPQSAKARPEVPCSTNATQTESPAAWKAVAQQNPSKWREMLARGPEFEQLSLRRLELETYELLCNTLQQHHVIETKTTTRRRKRKDIAAKPQDCSPKLACGSGLHLARSRKRRQQEHDRQMMLGKGRESSRVNKADNKRAIQDKTRTRSKLVNKKKSQKPPESQQTRQVSAQETQQKAANLLRQSRTARGPWIPSGLSSSLANRGKAFETCEMQVSMEKRVARVLDAFRTEADTHLRLSRNVQTQLKAQQSARERRPRKTDLTLETSTATKAHATSTRPKSANATVSRQTSNRSEQLHRNCSNQETEEPAAVEVKNPRPTQCALQSPDFGNETLLSESPATLTLVIPPLKLPAYLWEEQQTHDSFDSVSSDLSPVQNAVVRASNEPRMQSLELGVACEDPVSSIQSKASTNAATVAELKTSSEVKHDFVSPEDCDSTLGTSAKLDIADDLNAVKNEPEASCMDQDSGVDPIESANEENSYERQIVESTRQQFSVIVEEEYLAESLIEQASTGPSSENTEPSPTALRYEIPEQESAMTFPEKGCDDSNNLPGSGKDDDMNLWCTSNGDILAKPPRLHGEIKACDEEGAPNSSEERILVEDWMSPPQEISTWLPEDVNVTRSLSEKDSFATKESTLDVNNPEAGVTSAESDTDYVEQPVSVKHVVNKSPSSRIVAVGLGDTTDSVDISDSVRVSSRKIVEKDSDSIRLQPPQEEVESDDPLMLTTPAAMDVDSQLKQDDQPVKERDNIDGDAFSPREGLNDCESTIEKYPQVTEAPITTADLATTSPAEKVTSFTSVDDGSTSTSAVTDTEANPELVDPLGSVGQEPRPNPPSNSTGGDGEDLMQESSQVLLAIVDILVPPSPDATENVDQDPTQPWAEHHNAARKIQSQYRCFVRRQLILDQLRFMVAKKRRHTRRKTRQKVKKPKVVDMVTSASCLETESLVAVIAVDASSVDTILEEVQLVAPPSVSCAISAEMTPEPHSSEVPAEVVRVGARKGSSEYVFELFDDSVEVNKDMLDTATSRVEFMRSSTEKLDAQQQQNPATPPEKDAANSTKATTSIEVLQAEIVVSYQQPTLLPIEAIEVEPSIVNSRMLSELAFSDDVEKPAKPANAALVEAASEIAAMQPCWDRYVDSTTSKSFYYNPVTNETQWTAPDKDFDNAVINSPDKAAATGTDAVVSPSGQAAPTQGTWQEFLDEASGQLYYYNPKTGECSWEPPSGDSPGVVESLQSVATAESAAIGASSWVMYIDPASQAPYYVNVETLATSWEQPDSFTVAAVAGTTTANEDSYVIDDHVALEI